MSILDLYTEIIPNTKKGSLTDIKQNFHSPQLTNGNAKKPNT